MPIITFEQALPVEKSSANLTKSKPASSHIGFILDESSSMVRVWQDTIQGFNFYIAQLRGELPEAKITFASFVANKFKLRAEDKPIDEVLSLNTKSYTPYGSTPLVDSVMEIITMIGGRVLLEPNIKPVIVIQTDGQENASKKYTMYDLRDKITEKRKEGWRFILITCGIDSNRLAGKMGIDPSTSIEYGPGKTKEAFKVTARVTVQSTKATGDEEVVFALEDRRSLK